MKALRLRLRTPAGLLVDRPVQRIVAEDLDGWFGIRPGRRDLVAVLPPGLLGFSDADGEWFAALAGGLLEVRGPECRVMARDVVVTRDLGEIAARVREYLASRGSRARAQRDAVGELAREALRRLLQLERG